MGGKRSPRNRVKLIICAEIPRTAPFTAVKSIEWITETTPEKTH